MSRSSVIVYWKSLKLEDCEKDYDFEFLYSILSARIYIKLFGIFKILVILHFVDLVKLANLQC